MLRKLCCVFVRNGYELLRQVFAKIPSFKSFLCRQTNNELPVNKSTGELWLCAGQRRWGDVSRKIVRYSCSHLAITMDFSVKGAEEVPPCRQVPLRRLRQRSPTSWSQTFDSLEAGRSQSVLRFINDTNFSH
jgi:hypothetical protein